MQIFTVCHGFPSFVIYHLVLWVETSVIYISCSFIRHLSSYDLPSSVVQANMPVKFCQAFEVLTNDWAYLTCKRFYSSSLQKSYNSSYI